MDDFKIDDANYMHDLLIPYDDVLAVNNWCQINMQSRWRMTSYIEAYGAIPPAWYFESKEDHVAFVMRWG